MCGFASQQTTPGARFVDAMRFIRDEFEQRVGALSPAGIDLN